jgi:hypothetical protein
MSPPRSFAWIVPGKIAVAERPGGGGRTHRRERREAETAWWWAQGVRAIASGMRSRHGLVEYGLAGFAIRWHPLTGPDAAPEEMAGLVAAALELAEEGPVLVHVDYANEWLAGVDGALRLALGLATDPRDALLAAAADGFPVGPLAQRLVGIASERPSAPSAVE